MIEKLKEVRSALLRRGVAKAEFEIANGLYILSRARLDQELLMDSHLGGITDPRFEQSQNSWFSQACLKAKDLKRVREENRILPILFGRRLS